MKNFNSTPDFAENPTVAERLAAADPLIVMKFRSSNAEAARNEFLENPDLAKPNSEYSALNQEAVGELFSKIEESARALESDDNLGGIEKEIYAEQIENRFKQAKFLQSAVNFNAAKDDDDKVKFAHEYMDLNAELFGEPDRPTFESLMSEKLQNIENADLDERGKQLLAELKSGLKGDYSAEKAQNRFKPSEETIQRFGDGVRFIYGDQLALVPEKPKDGDKFTAEEIYEVFDNILEDLQGKIDATPFKLVWKESGGINVEKSLNEIQLPRQREPISHKKLEGLVVHEIGTHYMRGQIGEQYGIAALEQGTAGYLDSEEGIARAMEIAVMGDYVEAGVQHYITAGLATFEGMNFREAFEANWRLLVLEAKNPDYSLENIAKKQEMAYKRTQRIFRGTDELPWYKDLSYFNGAQKIWRYIEQNIDNPRLYDDLLLGAKTDLFNEKQQRQIYELKVGKQ